MKHKFKLDAWRQGMDVGCTDGHWYQLGKDKEGTLWLSAWADDGSLTEAELNALTPSEQIDLGGFCDVSDSAFDSIEDQFTFSSEIAPLLGVNALTIIRATRG